MDRGDWWATVHGVAKSSVMSEHTMSEHTHTHTHIYTHTHNGILLSHKNERNNAATQTNLETLIVSEVIQTKTNII